MDAIQDLFLKNWTFHDIHFPKLIIHLTLKRIFIAKGHHNLSLYFLFSHKDHSHRDYNNNWPREVQFLTDTAKVAEILSWYTHTSFWCDINEKRSETSKKKDK